LQVNNAGVIGTIIKDKELLNRAIYNRGVSMQLFMIVINFTNSYESSWESLMV